MFVHECECCQVLCSVSSIPIYVPAPIPPPKHALKSPRMTLSTSFFCDNSLRLVYIYREPVCDFNSNCLKPGKLYFAESSNS